MKNIYKLGLALCVISGAAQSAFAAQNLTTWNQSGVAVNFMGTTSATLFTGSGQSSTSTSAFGGTDGTILSKNVSLAAGKTVSFTWDFHATDYLPYNDFADVEIGSQVFRLSDVASLGEGGDSGAQSFSYTLTSAVTGPIAFIVSNADDNAVSSYVTISDVSAVPESTNMALMLAGMGLLGVVARRRSL